MAKAHAIIYKVLSPAGWAYTFDRIDLLDAGIDNNGTEANANAALDAIKPLILNLPGSLSKVTLVIDTFEG